MAQDRLLVVAAVEAELAPMARRLREREPAFSCKLLATGVGKVRTAMELALEMERWAPTVVVQIGCAGAYPDSGLEPGDVVLATEEVFVDEGVETDEGFLDLRAIGFPMTCPDREALFNEIPLSCPDPETTRALQASTCGRFRLVSGRLATVSTGSGSDARARAIVQRWHPLAENMEGAAAAVVAARWQCPHFEFRGISNSTGRRDKTAWQLELGCENAAEVAELFTHHYFASRNHSAR